MAEGSSLRHRFTPTQLEQYLDRIKISKTKRQSSLEGLDDEKRLEYFQLLLKHHLITVPWENLSMHYSWHHTIEVDPNHLLRKIATSGKQGRGGYCFETNILFYSALYALGFTIYLAGSRIYNPTNKVYGGWSHVVCIVTIGGVRLVADAGYGGNGLTKAIPLEHALEHEHVASSKMRLMYKSIAQNLDQNQKLWVYEHRVDAQREWRPMFCFTELEFLPEDIERLSVPIYSWRHIFFAHKVVAARFTTSAEGIDEEDAPGTADENSLEAEIDGSITLAHGRLWWRRNGVKVVELQLKTEIERLQALKKYFGIELDDDEVRGIRNTGAELTDIPFVV